MARMKSALIIFPYYARTGGWIALAGRYLIHPLPTPSQTEFLNMYPQLRTFTSSAKYLFLRDMRSDRRSLAGTTSGYGTHLLSSSA
jgi:hypothetical protein